MAKIKKPTISPPAPFEQVQASTRALSSRSRATSQARSLQARRARRSSRDGKRSNIQEEL